MRRGGSGMTLLLTLLGTISGHAELRVALVLGNDRYDYLLGPESAEAFADWSMPS
jgi:hypothetical protein